MAIYALVEIDDKWQYVEPDWLHLVDVADDQPLAVQSKLDAERRMWAIDNDLQPQHAHENYVWVNVDNVELVKRRGDLMGMLATIELFMGMK